jgi:hypothetical protein
MGIYLTGLNVPRRTNHGLLDLRVWNRYSAPETSVSIYQLTLCSDRTAKASTTRLWASDDSLGCYEKSIVYSYHPHTTDDLKMAITEYIWDMDRGILNTVFKNTVQPVNKCLETDRGHLERYLSISVLCTETFLSPCIKLANTWHRLTNVPSHLNKHI